MPNVFNPYQMYSYYPQVQQQPQMQPQPQVQPVPQIQNGGFVSVRSENEVFNYPVEPGRCVTFKIEGQPIVMEKSMGFSQLEAPHVERYRLVKEEPVKKVPDVSRNEVLDLDPINNALDSLKGEIKDIWSEINAIKENDAPIVPKRSSRKKEVIDDDTE